jgi:hypothetical protein
MQPSAGIVHNRTRGQGRRERLLFSRRLAAKESVMRYFFDIHLHGETHLDAYGKEFRSADEARAYVITCARICMAEGSVSDRTRMWQCMVEITDREGLSDVVMLADILHDRRNPRRVLQQAAQHVGIG